MRVCVCVCVCVCCPAQCALLNDKLDSLVKALNEESDGGIRPGRGEGGDSQSPDVPQPFKSKEQLMLRANSLKKALRQIIEQAEKGGPLFCHKHHFTVVFITTHVIMGGIKKSQL